MPDKPSGFRFSATCVGSVPFQDVIGTCRVILERFPLMPFWPQFVKRSLLEDMSIQYSEGLPLLEINEEKRSLIVSQSKEREPELVAFYEQYLAQDMDRFAISREYAPGLYALLDLMDEGEAAGEASYVKGQTVGPITFAAGILGRDGRPLLHDPELAEAMARGLAIKALWQVGELGRTGRRPIIFIDEPYLSGFGSAFSSIQRHEVIDMLRIVIDYLRENSDTLIGIHCCGNTDWSMIMDAGPDIVNFDAFDHMDYFLLYPEDIVRFFEAGGAVAWGIVPTSNFRGSESVEQLLEKIEDGLRSVHESGLSLELISQGSILTPACGMGTMKPDEAGAAMDLLYRLSQALS